MNPAIPFIRTLRALGGGTVALLALVAAVAASAAEIETLEVGLTTGGERIDALRVAAGRDDAPVVVLLGGLDGSDGSSRAIGDDIAIYAALPDARRLFTVIAIPVANPEGRMLSFPPAGAAYRDNAESHVLWRWLGLTAPDLVLVAGRNDAGLSDALNAGDVAGVASIPARRVAAAPGVLDALPASLPLSAAQREIRNRRARTPDDLAALLAPLYGQSFASPIYIDGMALIAHLALGEIELVQRLAEPWVDGSRDSLQAGRGGGVSTLVLAGHLVFAELAEITGDPRYLERARAAADTSFDANGEMLEAVPNHGDMSDAIFMGASILAAVGDLTGEPRYFDMAVRQIDFMNTLVRRSDGLYRHSPLTDAAWGRGNGFAAIGYALTLSRLPPDHPDFARLRGEYRTLMRTLASWQNDDGSWRQVVDYPGSYHETSSTAIIGFSMQRGIRRGWLTQAEFGPIVARAFTAVSQRTDSDGSFIDVSESTNKQPSLEAYLQREALHGPDPRTGAFALLLAVELSLP